MCPLSLASTVLSQFGPQDVLEKQNTFNTIFVAVAVLIALVFVGVLVYHVYNLAQPTITRKARVVGKRNQTRVSGDPSSVHSTTFYYCTFEFEDGTRREYSVGSRQYGLLAENDVGLLATKGALFWDFHRDMDLRKPE